jgi:hypothetical protein
MKSQLGIEVRNVTPGKSCLRFRETHILSLSVKSYEFHERRKTCLIDGRVCECWSRHAQEG